MGSQYDHDKEVSALRARVSELETDEQALKCKLSFRDGEIIKLRSRVFELEQKLAAVERRNALLLRVAEAADELERMQLPHRLGNLPQAVRALREASHE